MTKIEAENIQGNCNCLSVPDEEARIHVIFLNTCQLSGDREIEELNTLAFQKILNDPVFVRSYSLWENSGLPLQLLETFSPSCMTFQ